MLHFHSSCPNRCEVTGSLSLLVSEAEYLSMDSLELQPTGYSVARPRPNQGRHQTLRAFQHVLLSQADTSQENRGIRSTIEKESCTLLTEQSRSTKCNEEKGQGWRHGSANNSAPSVRGLSSGPQAYIWCPITTCRSTSRSCV